MNSNARANDWEPWPPTEEESAPGKNGKPVPVAKRLADLQRREETPESELLKRGFLCRGGGLLWCGPTGIGKSSLAMQAMISWALGRPLFGITPARPLKSLLVEAENDDGDLAEMRDGVLAGLELAPEECELALSAVMVHREDSLTSVRFFSEVVSPLLKEHRPDLLWVDPALAYLGGDAGSQRDVGGFLRNLLNPLLHEFDCGCCVIHHTNKPPSGKEKPTWSGADFAYLGSGSAEWANWARAVLALRSIGQRGVFELQAGKRGARIGWRDEEGAPVFMKHVAHSSVGICWREAQPEDVSQPGRPAKATADDLLALLPRAGLEAMAWKELATKEEGISDRTFYRLKAELSKAERIHKSATSDKWQPVTKPAK